jgi:hypothetical protein
VAAGREGLREEDAAEVDWSRERGTWEVGQRGTKA